MNVWNQSPRRLTIIQGETLLLLRWTSFSECCRVPVDYSVASKCDLYLMYECLYPIPTQITQDARPDIIHALLIPIFRMGQAVCLSCFDHKASEYIRKGQWPTKINILRLAVQYLNATINRSTTKPEPVIGTDCTMHTRQTLRVHNYRSGFEQPRSITSGFRMGFHRNWNVLAVQTCTTGWKPLPVAITSSAPIHTRSC